jgi:uncharacterized protein
MMEETMRESRAQVTAPLRQAAGEVPVRREQNWFASGDAECAAWHYPGANGACVIMAGGFAVTMEPGTGVFARRFHRAGFSVLAFDYRCFGESGGRPARGLAGLASTAVAFSAALLAAIAHREMPVGVGAANTSLTANPVIAASA